MTEKHLAECEKRLDDAHDLLDSIATDLRGAQEFRDAVYDILEGTPFGAQADGTYDGLYGRVRAAIESASPSPEAAHQEPLKESTEFLSPPQTIKAACLDCGKPYEDFGCDVLLRDSQWLAIHDSRSGLLCAQCIVNRAAKLPGCVGVQMFIEIAPHAKRAREAVSVPQDDTK